LGYAIVEEEIPPEKIQEIMGEPSSPPTRWFPIDVPSNFDHKNSMGNIS
jgi:hypothetical protein